MSNKLLGLFAATLTPLRADGALNLDQVPSIVSHLKRTGVAGIYVGGSTGEGMSLTSAERMELAEAFLVSAKGQLPTIVHVGHNSLAEARLLARHAWQAGADAISATAPSYYSIPNVRTLVDSMSEIASAVPDAPFYYYHIPSLTGAGDKPTVVPQTWFLQDSQLGRDRGIAPYIHDYQAAIQFGDGSLDALWGTDEMLLSAMVVGAKGAIGSTYNISAPLNNQLIQAYESGDLTAAQELQRRSLDLIWILHSFPFHAAMKSVLARFGVDCGPCRLPLANLTAKQHKQLHQMLDETSISQWLFEPTPTTTVNKPHVLLGANHAISKAGS